MEYNKCNIRFNTIGPESINAPINAKKFTGLEKLKTTTDMIPMKRIGNSEGIVAAWLATDEPGYVTGVPLFVNDEIALYPSFRGERG